MKRKTLFGWVGLLLISFSPVLAWFLFGPGTSELTNYSSITQSLGELTGLVGMTMFALTFMLSTRISWIEDIFGGLDKVYITHGILGGSALIVILSHPIFLVLKFIPQDIKQAALYLIPSSAWSVNFGIIALLGFILLIWITLFSKLKYHKWKFTHEFLGIVFFFAVLHVFLVRGNASSDNIFTGYYVYASIVSLIGVFGFSYSLFLKDRLFKAAKYRIVSIRKRGKETYEIRIRPEHKAIEYSSGQFIYLRFFNESLSKEAHPFSIASKSNSKVIKIIAKNLGDFTSRLIELNPGDYVSVEGPYGRFNTSKNNSDKIFIAGGIGITPFIGMAEDLLKNPSKEKIDLYYSCKNASDFVGLEELLHLEKAIVPFRVILWETAKRKHLNVEDINAISGSLTDKEFYLCGPQRFKESLIKGLRKNGVSEEKIHSEEFTFR